jgi:hypothetical protein
MLWQLRSRATRELNRWRKLLRAGKLEGRSSRLHLVSVVMVASTCLNRDLFLSLLPLTLFLPLSFFLPLLSYVSSFSHNFFNFLFHFVQFRSLCTSSLHTVLFITSFILFQLCFILSNLTYYFKPPYFLYILYFFYL